MNGVNYAQALIGIIVLLLIVAIKAFEIKHGDKVLKSHRVPEPMTGWKVLMLEFNDHIPTLISPVTKFRWESPVVGPSKPMFWRRSGFYAFNDRKRALFEAMLRPGCVVAEVRVWGRGITGEQGVRAEYAQIMGLVTLRWESAVFGHALASRYGVDVTEVSKAEKVELSNAVKMEQWLKSIPRANPR